MPFGDARAEQRIGDDTAAVIMETIPATGGYLVPAHGYFAEMRRLCDERGALLILDEVQADSVAPAASGPSSTSAWCRTCW